MEPGQVQDTIGGGQAWLEAEGMERRGQKVLPFLTQMLTVQAKSFSKKCTSGSLQEFLTFLS